MILFQDKILIRKDPEVNEGTILLPENHSNFEPIEGTVVNCGPGKVVTKRTEAGIIVKGAHKSTVKPGDRVLIQRNTEYNIKVDGEWLIVVKEADIIGVLDEAN